MFDIIQFRGKTSPYLEPQAGKANLNILKMVREGLFLELSSALNKAKSEKINVRKKGVRMNRDGVIVEVDFEVSPLIHEGASPVFLVLFEDHIHKNAALQIDMKGKTKESSQKQLERLHQELAATKEYLQSTIEELETSNEELQIASEEVLSSNEELQSINEELETSKEELQSTNEELTTLNEEMNNRNIELNQLNNDLNNLLSNANIPIIMLDTKLNIRRFTPSADILMNLINSDVGRPISHIKPNISIPDLEPLLLDIVRQGGFKEIEIQDKEKKWYLMRLLPYMVNNVIDGVVITFIDIDAQKKAVALRDNFISAASHELKTPITSLKMYIQYLDKKMNEEKNSKVKTVLGKIDTQVLRLMILVEDLLNATKLQHGKLAFTMEKFDLNELIQEAIETITTTTDKHKLILEGSISKPIKGDKYRIYQAITNLLSNAVKFSPKADRIIIKLDTTTDKVIITIQDFGLGVNPSDLDKIFSQFYRGERNNVITYPGLGMGLFIANEIIQRHNGQLSVVSKKGKGSTFTVQLPYTPIQN